MAPQFKNTTSKFHLGTNALSGKPLHLPLEELIKTHSLVLGRTGMGKSCLLEIILRAIIQNGFGLVFLDGKGDLFDNLQRFLAAQRLESKTVLVDPTDEKQSVGINYLELFGQTSPEALSKLVLEGMMKFFKEDTEYKPWLEEWGPASLLPLIKGGFTLLELFHFTSLKDPDFRNALLAKLGDGFYQKKWQELHAFRPEKQAEILNVVKTRASEFWISEPLKYIFGQTKTTINWLNLMNKGGTLLANLGRGPNMTEKTSSFIGTAIVHQLLVNAPLRPKNQRRPVFLVVDEFQKFVCNDFADALDRLRGYGIYLILSCQHLSQLSQENQRLYDSVLANCGNKLIFSISRQDAEEMALELFTGWIHKDRIKDEIWQTKFRPKETTREIVSEGYSETYGSSSSFALGSMVGETIGERGDLIVSSSSSSEMSSEIHGTSEGFSSSQTVSRVPWYEYEEFQEISSRTYYSLEEIKERYIAWVSRQDPRHLQIKLGSKKPLPVVTADIYETRVLPSWLRHFRDKVFAKTTLSVLDVKREIEGRVKGFLSAIKDNEKKLLKYPESFRQPKE